MDKVALLTAAERSELFRESAARRGMSPAVIEKDFWVCWVLKQLFAEPSFNERIVFKGGTSLSKVFGLIDRFSEDIDLVLDWRLLGYGAGMEHPRQELDSLTKRDRFSKAVNRKAAEYIAGTLIHDLTRLMARCPQVSAVVVVIDPHSVNISYQHPSPWITSDRRSCWRSGRSLRGCLRRVTESGPTRPKNFLSCSPSRSVA